MTNKRFFIVSSLLLLLVGVASAGIVNFDITFSIPSFLSHTLSYGSVTGTCSSTDFYFVENDTAIDGVQYQINASDSAIRICQNDATSALRVNNNGNVRINVTMELNQTTPTGTFLVASNDSQGYRNPTTSSGCTLSATAAPVNGNCHNITNSAAIIVANLAAQGNQSIWIHTNYFNANLGTGVGVAATIPRRASTNSTQTLG